jgi:hypothetical protein
VIATELALQLQQYLETSQPDLSLSSLADIQQSIRTNLSTKPISLTSLNTEQTELVMRRVIRDVLTSHGITDTKPTFTLQIDNYQAQFITRIEVRRPLKFQFDVNGTLGNSSTPGELELLKISSQISKANLLTRMAINSQDPKGQIETALGSLHQTVVPTVQDTLACRGTQPCLKKVALTIGMKNIGLGIETDCHCQH